MELNKALSVEEFQIVSRFEALRKILKSPGYEEHLSKPLAYWVLPGDRRLPLAFLGRKLQDLLETPFVELAATPGIGRKKLATFIALLSRAANTDPAELSNLVVDIKRETVEDKACHSETEEFNIANVSEVTWAQWRASVVRHGLVNEPLGRLAPSLQNMTRVIWQKPLGDYVDYTLAEIRAMRTYGEKRLHALLTVFREVYTITAGMGTSKNLTVRMLPRLIDRADRWIGQVLQQVGIPGEAEIYANYIEPLLEQLRIDATPQIVHLAESRLGINGPITSVRQVARNMGLTRARVYQLLNEINDIMAVRWPTGRHLSHELRQKLQTETADMTSPPDLQQFFTAVELFYPGNRRGASGSMERIAKTTLPEQKDTAEKEDVLFTL